MPTSWTHNWLVLACSLLVATLPRSTTATTDKMQIDPATGSWVDTHGRVRVFHGVNVVYKEPPWLPTNDTFDTQNSLVAEDMQQLQDWGFNVIRLGVMWPGLETAAGVYDTRCSHCWSHTAPPTAVLILLFLLCFHTVATLLAYCCCHTVTLITTCFRLQRAG